MDISKERIRRELKLIAKKKSVIESMLRHDESPKKPLSKSAQLSEEFRDSGNQLYIQDDHCSFVHFQILQYYNKSIAYAPSGSEVLALAFGSKSALLRHLHRYKECICEIDKALQITESTCLKIKLLCRKAECLTALGLSDSKNCLQKADFLFAKLEDSEKMKTSLRKLISKAQFIVKSNKLDKPAEDTIRKQTIKHVAKIEKSSIWDSVKIDYSKIYGKHLVAARDFEPGEIITVEKPYQNYFMGENAFEYCCYCLEFLWAAFPCDHCASRMFCSEKCKNRAWDEYHDMECPALLHLEKMLPLEKYNDIPFIIGIFFKALKEAGNISQLKSDLESLEKRRGSHAENYSQNETLVSYKSLYTASSRHIADKDLDFCVESSAMALIGLADGTKIFNESYSPRDLQNLRKNDVAIFAGALLLRFNIIITTGCHASKLADPEDLNEHDDEESSCHRMCSCGDPTTPTNKPTNFSVAVTSLMTIVGCFPNIEDCITSGNKLVIFALRPIKEGDKLCSSVRSIFDSVPKSERQAKHRKLYNCSCDCQACRGNWSATLQDEEKRKELTNFELKTITGSQIGRELMAISKESEAKSEDPNHPNLQTLAKAKDLLSKAWKHFSMPSPLIIASTKIMIDIFVTIFRVQNIPSDLLGSCEKKF